MYEFESRIRYSESDSDGYLKWTALLNYFQDCSTFQSEDGGVGVEYLKEINQAWVINSWQIDLNRMPRLGEEVIIGTIPYEIKKFLGFRNYYIKNRATGEVYAQANSVWTLIDMTTFVPKKADEKMIEAYAVSERLPMEYLDRKISFEGEGKRKPEFVIGAQQIDTNHHVNNEQYIQMALTSADLKEPVKRLRAEYKKQAHLNDIIIPVIYENEAYTGVSLEGTDGSEYVRAAFYR